MKILSITILLIITSLNMAICSPDGEVKGEYIITIKNKTNIDDMKKYLSAYNVKDIKKLAKNIYLIKSEQGYQDIKDYALKYKGIKNIEPNRRIKLISPKLSVSPTAL